MHGVVVLCNVCLTSYYALNFGLQRLFVLRFVLCDLPYNCRSPTILPPSYHFVKKASLSQHHYPHCPRTVTIRPIMSQFLSSCPPHPSALSGYSPALSAYQHAQQPLFSFHWHSFSSGSVLLPLWSHRNRFQATLSGPDLPSDVKGANLDRRSTRSGRTFLASLGRVRSTIRPKLSNHESRVV